MTKTIRIGVAGIAMIAAMGMSSVAHAQTETATASAEILEPLTLDVTGTLDFGRIIVEDAGTATIAAGGSVSCGTNLTCLDAGDSPEYAVTGTADRAVSISFAATSITLSNTTTGGSTAQDEMTVDNFTTDAGSNAVTLDNSGAGTFSVGGTLNVGTNQNAGNYTGSFDVSVDYS